MIITTNHMNTGMPAYEDMNGNLRHLALKPTLNKSKFKAALGVFNLIPRTSWIQVDRRPVYGSLEWILNQMQHGSCVGFSCAGAEMIQRDIRGLSYALLSGSYIYSWINGGSDNGASIGDALAELQQHGTCLDVTCPVNSIYRAQAKAGDIEAQRFMIEYGMALDSSKAFDWVCSIIQQGGIPQFAIEVGNNFENFDANGLAGYSAGGGNHSVYADGMIQINGTWYLTMKNSWGKWGPWGNGYVLLSENHIMGPEKAGGQDAFCHVSNKFDPNDTNNPVVPIA